MFRRAAVRRAVVDGQELAATAGCIDGRAKGCYVDRGYRGAAVPGVAIYRSGQRRGVNTRQIKRELKRRTAIEAVIGHMKTDGRMDRCRLKGALGDALHAVLCAAGHNIRLLMRHLAALLWLIVQSLREKQPAIIQTIGRDNSHLMAA